MLNTLLRNSLRLSNLPRNPLDLLKDGEPAFLETSRAAILAGIEALRESMQMPLERVALAGFSQGARDGFK